MVACAFDSDFARVAGLPVRWVNSIMTAVVAVGIVLTIRLIGIMLLISILTVPVIVAEIWCRRFISIMAMAAAVGVVSSAGGLFPGYGGRCALLSNDCVVADWRLSAVACVIQSDDAA